MIDDSIEYRSIIMRCDQIEKTAYRNLSSDMEIEFFKEGMETVWADVQKRAGEFKDVSDTDIIWSSANYGKIKPSREFFEMAIEQVLLDNPAEKRENIVFVGDTYNSDVRGANDAGIDVIWINHKGERNTENLSVHSISNTSELIGIVK